MLGLLLAGCATSPTPTPVTVSPVLVEPIAVTEGGNTNLGYVEVFNGTSLTPVGDFYRHYPQTGCRIYDDSGKQVALVAPQDTNSINAPTTVRIPAGHYKLVTESKTHGEVTMSLVVKPGRTDVVNLGVEGHGP